MQGSSTLWLRRGCEGGPPVSNGTDRGIRHSGAPLFGAPLRTFRGVTQAFADDVLYVFSQTVKAVLMVRQFLLFRLGWCVSLTPLEKPTHPRTRALQPMARLWPLRILEMQLRVRCWCFACSGGKAIRV